MKCQQQRQSSRRNDEIRTHICSTEWAILLKLRYVSCKVWDKVVCCANSNSCTVRIHSLPPDRLALLSWPNAPSQHRDCYGDEMTLNLVSQHLGEYLTPEEYSPLAEWTSNRFGIGYNRLGAIRLAQDFEGGQSWKKALQLLRSSRLCLSSLLTSQWVLCQLEVCPYKPRGLSLLEQSVFD